MIRLAGTVAPATRKRNKAREKEYGSIRPMTTMEGWDMSAQEAYASKSAMKRLDVVPDIGPAAGTVKALKGKKLSEYLRLGKAEVIKNPSTHDYQALAKEFRAEYPNAPKGEPYSRTTFDSAGNQYIWRSDKGLHPEIEEKIRKLFGVEVNQNKSMLPKPTPKVNRGDRVGPIVNDKLLPAARKPPVSPTEVTPFELQQLGLSKGAAPGVGGKKRYDMVSKTTLGPATRPKRGKK